jgi:hypothetical protein
MTRFGCLADLPIHQENFAEASPREDRHPNFRVSPVPSFTGRRKHAPATRAAKAAPEAGGFADRRKQSKAGIETNKTTERQPGDCGLELQWQECVAGCNGQPL